MASGIVTPWAPVDRQPAVDVTPPFQFPLTGVLKFFLLILIAGQLGRIPVASAGAKEAPLLINDLVLMVLIGGALLAAIRSRRLVVDGVAGLGLLFAAVGASSVLLSIPRFGLSAFELAFSLAYLARWLAYFGVYLVVLNFVARDQIEEIWRAVEVAILGFAAFGIFQSAFLPGFAQMVYPDSALYTQWDPQGHRLVSTFLDPNLAGGLIIIGLLVQLGRVTYGAPVAAWKPLLLAVASALTVSRSTALALVAGGAVLLAVRGLSKRGLRLAAASVVALILALPFLVQLAVVHNKLDLADPSLLTRFVAWARALTVFSDHPVIGVGFNTYGFVQYRYGFEGLSQRTFGLDGGLLFIAVMTGVLGVAVYAGMIGTIARRARQVWRDRSASPQARGLAAGTAAATVAVLVHSLFTNSLLYPFIMEVLWVLWALVAVQAMEVGLESGPSADPG